MATSYKVLGQNKVTTAATPVVLYYANPSSSAIQTIVSTITICNTNSVQTTYRIAVVPSATSSTSTTVPTLATENYIVYDAIVAARETVSYTIGLTLDTYDKIIVNSGNTGVAFSAFGSETQ
jgi:hypothetical protein